MQLGGPTHHDHVARSRGEIDGASAGLRAHRERPPGAETDDSDQGVVQVAEFSIGVRRDAVSAVSVVIEGRSAQRPLVAPGECRTERRENRMQGSGAGKWPVRQSRIVDHAIPHAPPPLAPRDDIHELAHQRVGATEPAAGDVEPRGVVEPAALEARLAVEGRLVTAVQRELKGHRAMVANKCSTRVAEGWARLGVAR